MIKVEDWQSAKKVLAIYEVAQHIITTFLGSQ